MKKITWKLKPLAFALLSASLLSACGGGSSSSPTDNPSTDSTELHNLDKIKMVLNTNAEIAYAAYSDSVDTAQALLDALIAFRKNPTQANLDAAKQAWLVAREPYGQTEVYRFRHSPIDSTDYSSEDGPEGDINAWPLGEALIDYVQTNLTDFTADQVGITANDVGLNGGGALDGTNPNQNIIANTSISIDANLLAHNATAEDEHDVISGYHAIEFLLWGQDLNHNAQATDGTNRNQAVKTTGAPNLASGGQRPLSDFGTGYQNESDYNANDLGDRRLKYLEVVATKLVEDLTQVRDGWADGSSYRNTFTSVTTIDQGKQKLAEILVGMGTLSQGELAGERMKISLSANSQEDEHSCFSDNTHRDIWLNAEGIANSYYGDYAGYDSDLDGIDDAGRSIQGYGIDDYLTDIGQASLAVSLDNAFTTTETNYKAIDAKARAGKPVDVVIMDSNSEDAKPMNDTINALVDQAGKIVLLAQKLEIDPSAIETSIDDATDQF